MNATIIRNRSREHLPKICCLVAITLLSLPLSVRGSILDDLFKWAAQQPSQNITTIQFHMTSNEITRNGLISYSESILRYYPAHFNGFFFVPASFSSNTNGITQYFSDRRFNCVPNEFVNFPFGPNNTDPLTISISPVVLGAPTYAIDVNSSKWGFNYRWTPSFDANTKILYGTNGNDFLTVSLYDQSSQPQPQIQ
jgi:hypothetical protein